MLCSDGGEYDKGGGGGDRGGKKRGCMSEEGRKDGEGGMGAMGVGCQSGGG